MKAGKAVRYENAECIRRVLPCLIVLLFTCAVLAPRISSSQFSRVTAVPGNSISMGHWAEPPRVCNVCPCCGLSGTCVCVFIYGKHFQVGATVELRGTSAVIKGRAVKVFSSHVIGCSFDLKGAAPGFWDFAVTNPDGGCSILARGFNVIGCGVKDAEEAAPVPEKPEKTPAPETPAPETPETPVSEKPVPETPAPEKPAPETPAPEKKPVPEKNPAPEKPAPETPVPEKPAPETPETPVPEKPVPKTPAPETPAPEVPKTPTPDTPVTGQASSREPVASPTVPAVPKGCLVKRREVISRR